MLESTTPSDLLKPAPLIWICTGPSEKPEPCMKFARGGLPSVPENVQHVHSISEKGHDHQLHATRYSAANTQVSSSCQNAEQLQPQAGCLKQQRNEVTGALSVPSEYTQKHVDLHTSCSVIEIHAFQCLAHGGKRTLSQLHPQQTSSVHAKDFKYKTGVDSISSSLCVTSVIYAWQSHQASTRTAIGRVCD